MSEGKDITGLYDEFLKVSVEKLKFEKDDVLLLRGEWDETSLHNMFKLFQDKDMENIVIVLPEGKDIETIGIKQFYDILKEIENKCRSINHGRLDVNNDTTKYGA